ncbi:MAG: hypothetical protein GY751_08030 [Bacteroidetes bacterium]|nr:hypothetical protein [Bacteroidota bacterium]
MTKVIMDFPDSLYICDVKQFCAFVLAVFMLGLSSQNALLIVLFKINQQYIANAVCENRNTTEEKVCNGTCYLEDQLIEQNDMTDHEQLPAMKEVKETVLFFNVIANLVANDNLIHNAMAVEPNNFGLTGYLEGVFHPPQV